MCTLAWNVAADGLWVCFNRDENRDRPRAYLPQVHSFDQQRIACAHDPEGGGTWLAVSSAGFIVALMNNYEQEFNPLGKLVSRGRLVLEVAREASPLLAQNRVIKAVEVESYAPFYLFLLSPDRQLMWSWDGIRLSERERCPKFWTTSSYESQKVFEWRKQQWEREVQSNGLLLPVAVDLLGERRGHPAYSMTMDRTDARTVSQSTIRMQLNGMTYQYAERQPDSDGYMKPVDCGW